MSLPRGRVDVRSGAAGPLTTDLVEGDRSIVDRLAPEWQDLCAEAADDQPYYRPEWIAAYLEAFAPDAALLVITVRQDGRLAAVLPLLREWGRFCHLPVRKLRSPVGVHSGRFDLVVSALLDRAALVRAVWQVVRRTPGWDLLELNDVPERGAAFDLLRVAAEDGHPVGHRETLRTPYIPLAGRGHGPCGQDGGPDPKFRANLRRRMKRLNERGVVRLVRHERADPSMLDAFYALEQSGWKGRAGTAIGCEPATRRFYDEIVRGADRFGYLSLYGLELNGQPVAGQLGLTYRGRYGVPKLAYDERFRDCAPGHLLVGEVLGDLARRGVMEFDFLGPAMPWKAEWTDAHRPHACCYVFSHNAVGRALHGLRFHAVPAARRLSWGLRGRRAPGRAT